MFIYGRLIRYFRTEYSAARQRTCLGSRGPQVQILLFRPLKCGNSSVGRASAFQAECREFEPRFPLQLFMRHQLSWQSTRLLIVLSQVQILYDAPFNMYLQLSWIEQRPSKAWVGGSNPSRYAIICGSIAQFGQSTRLITEWSLVRVQLDPPFFL